MARKRSKDQNSTQPSKRAKKDKKDKKDINGRKDRKTRKNRSTSNLPSLPSEILFQITDYLHPVKDINSLTKTCRSLHNRLIIRLYLEDAKRSRFPALAWGVENDEISILRRTLIEAKISPNFTYKFDGNQWAPLISAVCHHDKDMVDLFLASEKIDINFALDNGETALCKAAWEGRKSIVRLLLDHGANVNAPVVQNPKCRDVFMPPLISALVKQRYHIAEMFLKQEAVDANVTDSHGRPALHLAVLSNDIRAVKLLLDSRKVDVNAQHPDGETALIHASEHGYEGIVKLLLTAPGIDPNIQPPYRPSALFAAARFLDRPLMKTLIQGGADPNQPNNKGTLPWDLFWKNVAYRSKSRVQIPVSRQWRGDITLSGPFHKMLQKRYFGGRLDIVNRPLWATHEEWV